MAAAVALPDPGRFAYLKPKDVARLAEAYRFSEAAHAGQTRQSGDPYISHPLAVAEILAGWHLDGQALMAALLHDVMEDTTVTKDEISDTFGKPVAELVDGVSKLDRSSSSRAEDAQAENFRKMLLAMARDVRVILIKLADRLHNMRTLDAVPPGQAPARRARDDGDLRADRQPPRPEHALPRAAGARLLAPLPAALPGARQGDRGGARQPARGGRQDRSRRSRRSSPRPASRATVHGREKHLYSIYRKMIEKHLSFSEVHDIYGFRVIVKDVPACYLALGALHGLYKPIPGKFKDYIAIPKANGYQSLHTDADRPLRRAGRGADPHRADAPPRRGRRRLALDVQGRRRRRSPSCRSRPTSGCSRCSRSRTSRATRTSSSSTSRSTSFPDEVYVFTPKGRILSLPRGATAVDFAYAVHTDIGNRCVAAKVNGELVPLRTELRNGDRVEIITASHAKPNPAWLQYVRTGKARSNIRHFLKTMQYEESAGLGERLLEQALKALETSLAEIDDANWERVVRDSGAPLEARSCSPTSAWASACPRSWRGGC